MIYYIFKILFGIKFTPLLLLIFLFKSLPFGFLTFGFFFFFCLPIKTMHVARLLTLKQSPNTVTLLLIILQSRPYPKIKFKFYSLILISLCLTSNCPISDNLYFSLLYIYSFLYETGLLNRSSPSLTLCLPRWFISWSDSNIIDNLYIVRHVFFS